VVAALVVDAQTRRHAQKLAAESLSYVRPEPLRLSNNQIFAGLRWIDIALFAAVGVIALLLLAFVLLLFLSTERDRPPHASTVIASSVDRETMVSLDIDSHATPRLGRPVVSGMITFLLLILSFAGVALYVGGHKKAGGVLAISGASLMAIKDLRFMDKLVGELKVPISGSVSIGGGGLAMTPLCKVGPFLEASHDIYQPDKTRKVAPITQVPGCWAKLENLMNKNEISFVAVIGQTDRRELNLTPRNKYGSNSGLAHNRAAEAEKALLANSPNAGKLKDRFLLLTTGALETDTLDDEKLGLDRAVTVIAYSVQKPRFRIERQSSEPEGGKANEGKGH
jgi:hypothetical protein